MSDRWPLRVRFAHWVLAMISPWLAETPYDEDDLDDGQAEYDAAYQAGLERGYEEAREQEARGEDGPWAF